MCPPGLTTYEAFVGASPGTCFSGIFCNGRSQGIKAIIKGFV